MDITEPGRRTNTSNSNTTLGNFGVNVVRFCFNYQTRCAIAGILVYVSWIALVNYSWFTWHVILCTLGYIPLMAESVMLFTGDDLWTRQLSRTAKYTVHGVIVTVATIIIIVGDALVFHYLEPGYHLYTAHGITGLVSLILILLSVPAGLIIKYHREVSPHLPIGVIWFKALHNLLGIAGYLVGIISLGFAFYTNWFVFYTEWQSRLAALIFTITVAVWTLNGAVVSLYHQFKTLISR